MNRHENSIRKAFPNCRFPNYFSSFGRFFSCLSGGCMFCSCPLARISRWVFERFGRFWKKALFTFFCFDSIMWLWLSLSWLIQQLPGKKKKIRLSSEVFYCIVGGDRFGCRFWPTFFWCWNWRIIFFVFSWLVDSSLLLSISPHGERGLKRFAKLFENKIERLLRMTPSGSCWKTRSFEDMV